MKESRKEFIKKAHSAACIEWKENIEKEFPELFKEDALVVGKWYKSGKCLFNYQKQSNVYGFFIDGIWTKGGWSWHDESAKPATDKEVEEALIKEAKKRGFKEENHVRCLNDGRIRVITEYHMSTPDWEVDVKGGFNLGDITVMLDGKWVKPVETITKEQAEKELGKTILN